MAKILVVDDERPLSTALSLKLSKSGYEVDVANGGQEALDKIATNKYDLIMLDLIMPDVNGFEVLKKLNATKTMPRVIVMSNLNQLDDVSTAMSLGAEDYLVKANTAISDMVNKVAGYLK